MFLFVSIFSPLTPKFCSKKVHKEDSSDFSLKLSFKICANFEILFGYGIRSGNFDVSLFLGMESGYLFGHSKNNESGLNAKKSIIRKNDVNNLKERILDIPSGTIEIDSKN